MNLDKRRGKPTKKRKGAGKMQTASTATNTEKNRLKELFAKTRDVKMHRHAIPAKKDELLHDGMSEFERQLILGCREDGMSDDEIREWMQEI